MQVSAMSDLKLNYASETTFYDFLTVICAVFRRTVRRADVSCDYRILCRSVNAAR